MLRITSSSPYVFSDFDRPERDPFGLILIPLDDVRIAIKRFTGRVPDIRMSPTTTKELVSSPEGFRVDSWSAIVVGDVTRQVLEKVGARGIGAWSRRGFGRFFVNGM